MKRQRRIDSGSVGSSHDKVYIGQALRKVEANYYAHRVAEAPKKPRDDEKIKEQRRARQRANKSTLDRKTVANMRWLKEIGGWKTKDIAVRYKLDRRRTANLLDYRTWAEVMPEKPDNVTD